MPVFVCSPAAFFVSKYLSKVKDMAALEFDVVGADDGSGDGMSAG